MKIASLNVFCFYLNVFSVAQQIPPLRIVLSNRVYTVRKIYCEVQKYLTFKIVCLWNLFERKCNHASLKLNISSNNLTNKQILDMDDMPFVFLRNFLQFLSFPFIFFRFLWLFSRVEINSSGSRQFFHSFILLKKSTKCMWKYNTAFRRPF